MIDHPYQSLYGHGYAQTLPSGIQAITYGHPTAEAAAQAAAEFAYEMANGQVLLVPHGWWDSQTEIMRQRGKREWWRILADKPAKEPKPEKVFACQIDEMPPLPEPGYQPVRTKGICCQCRKETEKVRKLGSQPGRFCIDCYDRELKTRRFEKQMREGAMR